ncbi:bifunctional phosphopantothenoylcysteine decarboxylase/phosphopantothenate--cysteine ligase CoaBC [Thermophagus xiamenensis]|uniref:Coenzyme A biosynthesis bifunctional protein CoaBC n=1 Tax=Thermophagus xiamenensis TaxID=385682 RepID=A0A1I2EYN7_9BACT|nr:bifunctional phosphopantothenoylcysteine decarboxylase/phosphopantothenate--cysteine ligase CoaBC [Thermophagus xiamenensis]SFE97737.1 Phosphopantothenate-cysteine ligase /Phosphopantothenoylcysteine decarboxylase [Thermophagus xiamenensis]
MLKGKKVILGITGSIAAYKAVYLLRLLVKEGAEVQVIITPAGKEFITPVTLSALSGKPVLSDFFENADGSWHSHVDLGLWADILVIAPASANTMGKMANAICDNLLITTYLSAKCPVLVAPAMDLDMYAHPANQRNIDLLRRFGTQIVEPASGELASGLQGKGRMEEPEVIVQRIKEVLAPTPKSLLGRKILITAGPTFENIDPVRFIGNYSSGKMGFALAEEAAKRGAEVFLISGPVNLETNYSSIYRRNVISAKEMYEACREWFPACDVAIFAAAVADFSPDSVASQKIKRNNDDWVLHLKANPDIAASMGQMKKANQLTVGFALETNNEEKNARRKLNDKNLDFIVLNSPNNEGEGFMADTNRISIIYRDGRMEKFPLKSKKEVAADIISAVEKIL